MAEGFLNPSEILSILNLKETMIAADFGCGSGGWAIPLAKILKKGRVYGIDILEEPLSALRSRARMERLYNIDALRGDVEKGTTLLSESCDLVLMTNLLFQVKEKKKVLEEGKRVLKKDGKILIVDWIKDNPLTKEIEFLSFEEIKEMAKEIGLEIEKEFKAGDYHLGLILTKK